MVEWNESAMFHGEIGSIGVCVSILFEAIYVDFFFTKTPRYHEIVSILVKSPVLVTTEVRESAV